MWKNIRHVEDGMWSIEGVQKRISSTSYNSHIVEKRGKKNA
jgi:hypothetical protein